MSSELEKCPTCGGAVVADFRPGEDDYADTPGGHADRHTLVVEAAERALTGIEEQA
jgi:hypothetical protein